VLVAAWKVLRKGERPANGADRPLPYYYQNLSARILLNFVLGLRASAGDRIAPIHPRRGR